MVNNKRYLSKNMYPEGPELVTGRGIEVYDKSGNKFFDLTSQTLNLNLGHNHPIVTDALNAFFKKKDFPYYSSPRFENKYVCDLSVALAHLAPNSPSKVNLQMCNGSDANEDAFKRARKYYLSKNRLKKANIVSMLGSHLGVSAETISASGEHFGKEPYLGGSGNFVFMRACNTFRRPQALSIDEYAKTKVDEFKDIVESRGDISGVITELVLFDAGILVQPQTFVKGIERVCNENDITLIVDEVQTAFGWCGSMFLSSIYKIKPDIITLAKGLTAGFPALSATVFKEKYDILEPGISEYTFGAQALGCAVAMANIKYLKTSGIMSTVQKKHQLFIKRLTEMKDEYEILGDVRGIGLILGLEFVKKDGSRDMDIGMKIYREALKMGLLVNMPTTDEGKDNVISIKPPIVITEDEINYTMDILNDSFKSVVKHQ